MQLNSDLLPERHYKKGPAMFKEKVQKAVKLQKAKKFLSDLRILKRERTEYL
jgi:hypothetical protein